MTDAHVFDLTGKTALISGTTSGFGRHMAITLAKAGAHVAITGRRVERLDDLKKEIEAFDGRALPIALDVTDMDSIKTCIETCETELGPLDILVNNAGMNIDQMATDVTEDSYDTVMDTNLKGSFFMAQEAAKRMIEKGRPGRIINIASIGGHTVLPGLSVYCMSKASVLMMTKSLAREWARYDINVTALCPGFIETELNAHWFATEPGQKQVKGYPRRRLGEIADLDGALLLMASDQGRIITGTSLTIDDGQSL